MNQVKVSQNYIFNLLAGDEYEYPLLQKEAVEKITKNITDIVYTTLRQKSTASSVKRCNLLHLMNITCQTPEFHLMENSPQIYLNHYQQDVCNSSGPYTDSLLSSINNKEQQVLSVGDIHAEVLQFYKRKNSKRKEFVKRLELIKQNDVEELQKVNMSLTKTVSSYETDQNLIDKLLKVVHAPVGVPQVVSLEVRKKHVGFLYAIVNIDREHTKSKIVNYILDKLQSYETLQKYEIKLLEDLWMKEEYTKRIVQKFPFVLERIIIRFCQEIVKLAASSEVSHYFLSLTDNLAIRKLQRVCAEDLVLHEGSLVNIFTADGGSIINLRLFPDGLVSFNIDYHQSKSETAYDVMEKLESRITKSVPDLKWSRSLPGIKSHETFRYYVSSDCRLLEYDVDKVVFEEVTRFQKVQIVHSITLGNILVLDNLQNLSEADLVYTETLMQRGKENYKDKSVLILGGGDGALLYELLKEQPKEVIMVEIDNVVMLACSKYMRSVCGNVLDNYEGPNYKIIMEDCMVTLEKFAKEGKKFDYVFGDLTDVPISMDHSTELWAFINQVLELSFKVLQPNGKFMTHVTGTSSQSALESYKKQLEKLNPPVTFTLDKAYVPSFYEEWIFCQVSFANKE